jgi:hypothetical protein
MKETDTGIPRGSPVSPILFAIYISGIFEEIEAKTGAIGISFIGDVCWLAIGSDVTTITTKLEECATLVKEWAKDNVVEFDEAKSEAIFFKKKKDKRKLRMNINLGNSNEIAYNKGATRWLEMWMDSAFNFNEHFTKRMAKAAQKEKELQRLHGKYGMTPCNIRNIMTATVQSTALFRAEIWWRNQKDKAKKVQKMINRHARAITGYIRPPP